MSKQTELEKLNKQLDLIAAGQSVTTEDELLKTALLITELKSILPEAAYQQETKAKFLQKARELKVAREKQVASGWLKPRRWLAAVAFAFLLSSGSVVYAANGAMPDSWLYSVKQVVEKVALAMPLSQNLKTKIKLAVAKRRLAEANYLKKKNQLKEAQQLLKRNQQLLKETGLKQPSSLPLKNKKPALKSRLKIKPKAPKFKNLKRQPTPNKLLKQNLKPVSPQSFKRKP